MNLSRFYGLRLDPVLTKGLNWSTSKRSLSKDGTEQQERTYPWWLRSCRDGYCNTLGATDRWQHCLGGQSLEKGRERAGQLDREAVVTGCFSARSIGVADAAQARQCSNEQDIVIVAYDLSVSAIENLVQECIANRADYIDITPNPRKLEVFHGMRTLIGTSDG